MPTLPDAYGVLQISHDAEDAVVTAAYRALAKQYHPDGSAPNVERMAAINRAYALVRSAELRAAYDRQRRASVLMSMGPGRPMRRPHAVVRPPGSMLKPSGSVLSFGRYAGWSIRELGHHDPDYLRWLARHSSGLRYRDEIRSCLGPEPDLERRSNTIA